MEAFYNCETGVTHYALLFPFVYLELIISLIVFVGLSKVVFWGMLSWQFPEWRKLKFYWLLPAVLFMALGRCYSYYYIEMPWVPAAKDMSITVAGLSALCSILFDFAIVSFRKPFTDGPVKAILRVLLLNIPLMVPTEFIFALAYLSDGWSCWQL